MPSKDSVERRRRRTGVSRRKQLSKLSTSTKLWLADEQVLQEIARRKETSPGQLVRDIIHQWATTMRVSGQANNTTDANAANACSYFHDSTVSPCELPATAPVGVLPVTAEGSGRREFAEFMSNHLFGHENGYVDLTVVDGDRVSHHPRKDR